jgi:glycosyltransferase involved in cell wall biosynthesis
MPRKISVLIVNSTLHIGGAEQVAGCLAEGIDRGLFNVAACYLKEPGLVADQMVQGGVELLQLPGFQVGRRDYLSSLKLRRLIRARGVRIIHTHDIHGMIDGSICRGLLPDLRFVHTFHFGNYPHRSNRHQLIESALWRVPHAIVAVGHAQAEAIRACYNIPLDRLRVIWNGVEDPTNRGNRESLNDIAPPGIPVIASISTLIPQKGLEFLLRTAAILRDSGERFVLLLAGGGILQDSLRAQALDLRLGDHVRFLGWLPQASNRVLPVCDIFVQSSIWEAMSIVVLEAMAAGKAMVVTRVGENPSVVVDGETGITVPPANPEAMAAALRRLLHDGDLRRRLGQAARRRYEDTFTTQHMITAYEDLYRELIDEPSVTSPPISTSS